MKKNGIEGVIMSKDEKREDLIWKIIKIIRIGKGRGKRIVEDEMDEKKKKIIGGVIMKVVWS